jgi:hypothetical protein
MLGPDWYAPATARDGNPQGIYRICLLRLENDVFRSFMCWLVLVMPGLVSMGRTGPH